MVSRTGLCCCTSPETPRALPNSATSCFADSTSLSAVTIPHPPEPSTHDHQLGYRDAKAVAIPAQSVLRTNKEHRLPEPDLWPPPTTPRPARQNAAPDPSATATPEVTPTSRHVATPAPAPAAPARARRLKASSDAACTAETARALARPTAWLACAPPARSMAPTAQ